MAALENGSILGSIPVVVNDASEIVEYTDLPHLNIQYNPSSFAVIPVMIENRIECRSIVRSIL